MISVDAINKRLFRLRKSFGEASDVFKKAVASVKQQFGYKNINLTKSGNVRVRDTRETRERASKGVDKTQLKTVTEVKTEYGTKDTRAIAKAEKNKSYVKENINDMISRAYALAKTLENTIADKELSLLNQKLSDAERTKILEEINETSTTLETTNNFLDTLSPGFDYNDMAKIMRKLEKDTNNVFDNMSLTEVVDLLGG